MYYPRTIHHLSQGTGSIPFGAIWPTPSRPRMSRWNNGGPLEEREAPHLGCDLSGHLCPSYSAHATREAGAVAAPAEERKVAKYVNLTSKHLFFPIAVETMGVLGPNTYQGAPQGPRSPGDQDNKELGGSYHLPHPTAVSGSAAGQLSSNSILAFSID